MKFKRRFVKKFKYNYKTRFLIPLFVLVCVALGLGYAYLQTDLSIVGVTKLKDNEWNVHFDNIQPVEGSVEPVTAPVISELTTVSFSAQLENPGDKYEFYIDVVNSGTIDAMVDSLILLPELTTDQAKYLSYQVTYRGGAPISQHELLTQGQTRTLKVSFKYLENVDTSNYPQENTTFNISATVNYVQANNQAVDYIGANPCTYNGELVDGANYSREQYSYSYSESKNGWTPSLINRNSTDPVTEPLCSSINEKPMVSMSGMFANSKTTSIDMSSFETFFVTDMSGMFINSKVLSLDLTNFDTSNVTNMTSMFQNNTSLTELNLGGFNTKKVTNMATMFYGVSSITELNLSSFNTSNVTTMYSMFYNMASLETLILDNFDFSHYNDFNDGFLFYSYFFGGNTNDSIKHLSLENAKLPPNCGNLFYGIPYVKILNLKNVDTSTVTNMSYMFYFGPNTELEELDLSSFDTSNVTDMRYMFKYVPKLKELDLSNFDITSVEVLNLYGIFDGVNSLEKLNLSGFDLSAYENATLSGVLIYYNLSELVTPKDLRIGTNTIPLKNRMYAQGDSVGITVITKDTPTNTVYKSQPWN